MLNAVQGTCFASSAPVRTRLDYMKGQKPSQDPLRLILMLCEAFLVGIRFFREIFLQLADLRLHILDASYFMQFLVPLIP